MSYLEKIINLTEEKRLEAEKEKIEENNNYKKIQEIQKKLYKELLNSITNFSKELRERTKIYVKHHPYSDIVVFISSGSPFIRKPYCKITISPSHFSDGYSCRTKLYNNEEDKFEGTKSLSEVLDLISENVADFLIKEASLEHERPYWYINLGNMISWPLFFLSWFLFANLGGVWGFFLGWIPSIIIKYFAELLWLPLLAFIILSYINNYHI